MVGLSIVDNFLIFLKTIGVTTFLYRNKIIQ